MMDIKTRLIEVFARQFNIEPAMVSAESSPKTVKDWDSMKHVELVLEVEDVFGVSFGASEVFGLTSFAGVHEALAAKLGPAGTGA